MGLLSLQKRRLTGNLTDVYRYLNPGGCQGVVARLRSVVLSNWARDNGQKLMLGKFHLNKRKKFFRAQ